jgi:hypothetical protein
MKEKSEDGKTYNEALAAVKLHGALEFIPEQFKTAELCLAAVKRNGMALDFVPEKLKTRELCLAAAMNTGTALMYAPREVWDRNFCLAVLESSAVALAFVPEEYCTEEICCLAVEWHGEALAGVPEQFITVELCKIAIAQSAEALEYVPEQLREQVLKAGKNLCVIPQEPKSLIAEITGGAVREVKHIDVPFDCEAEMTENGILAVLCRYTKKTTLKLFDKNGNLCEAIPAPATRAIAGKGNIVYLGGAKGKKAGAPTGESFSLVDLSGLSPGGAWPAHTVRPVALPVEITQGKAIDDCLVNGNTLTLVDNITFPKYLIQYDICSPAKPKHVSTQRLPSCGTYEHVEKGCINDDYFVWLSSTMNFGNMGRHIAITGKKEGHLCISSNTSIRGRKNYLDDSPELPASPSEMRDLLHWNKKEYEGRKFLDICLIKNRLYISRQNKIGFMDLDKALPGKKPAKKPLTRANYEAQAKEMKERYYFASSLADKTVAELADSMEGVEKMKDTMNRFTAPLIDETNIIDISTNLAGRIQFLKTPDGKVIAYSEDAYQLLTDG